MNKKLISAICILSFAVMASASDPAGLRPYDISARLMRSTFKIEGENSTGTVFIIAEPSKKNHEISYYVLITAAHVLENIKGDLATVYLRRFSGNRFKKYPFIFRIRDRGKPLWVRHNKADVAAMHVALPRDIDIYLVATSLLATDEMLDKFEIHPGDELLVLGYPHGAEANEAGFPILRSGKIASYPLTPTKDHETFLLDFNVFKGNSGGPVFIYSENRFYEGGVHLGAVKFIVGVVSEEWTSREKVASSTEIPLRENNLGLAVVVHASYVKEILEMLPPLDE